MSGGVETRDIVRSWSLWGIFGSAFFIVLLHLQVTRLIPESWNEFFVLTDKIFPLSIDLRYLFRGLFIFSSAYSSMASDVVFKKEKPNGIIYFCLASGMLLYGYVPSLDWYNAFVFPITPFVVLLNARHLPNIGIKIKTREHFYNNYQRNNKEDSIHFPLEKKRVKSEIEKDADLSHDFIIREPDETLLIEAGTGKGKSRGCLSHYIHSCIENNWNIVIHEFKGNPHNPKHPELTKFAIDSIKKTKKTYGLNVIGFTDPAFTKRCNIYDPSAIKTEQDIRSVNEALMYSLNKSWAKQSGGGDPFWKDNSISLANGVALTAQVYRPECLTLPHMVAMIIRDTDEVIDAFMNVPDRHLRIQFQAFKNSYALAKETAGGVISSTQIPLVQLNDSMMFWALSGNESMGEDYFTLDFDSKNPFILSVCNNATRPVHTHGVNTYLRSILSRLSFNTNRPTALILDEYDQIFIDGLDRAIATVREVGTKIVVVLQTYEQLADKMGVSYADKVMALGQNRIIGGGSSPASAKKFVEGYVPKYQDLEMNLSQTGSSDDSAGIRTADKKIVEAPDITGQEKFHFSGVVSTGSPNTFYNLPFKVNPANLEEIKLPFMSTSLKRKYEQFEAMIKVGPGGNEIPVSPEEVNATFEEYKNSALSQNRDRIFRESDTFIEDLKHGLIS